MSHDRITTLRTTAVVTIIATLGLLTTIIERT